MVVKKHLYRLVQVVALTLLLVTNGFILNYILNIENGFGKDKNLDTLKECQTNKEASFFGFNPSVYQLSLSKVKYGQSLSQILNAHNIPHSRAETIIGNLSQVINLNSIRAGNTLGFAGLNPCLHPDFLIYEVDDSKYITCELRGDLCANVVEKPTSYMREQAMGIIESTLWDALQAQNLSLDLIDQMEDALSSSVDFHHVQKGNTFKLIFDRRHLDGQPTPSGRLIAAYFDTGDREAYAISYLVQNKKGFYDLKGSPMASKFLQAPVRFSRISSGFNMKRFHPVLKYHRPHLGTDYAAPYGTPIMAVGAGVVESASYTAGNGNFVKIRHDKTYQTQYLHMSKFAKGIRKGAPVSQGQVIGYVGSTGLASGPHVCFRFWKDGRQVNHRALRFPSPDPLPPNLIQDYYKHRDSIVKVFDSMQFNTALNDRS